MTDFARQWQANGERLRELERERSAHQAERESYEAFLPPLRKQYEDAAKAYDEKNQSYTRLRSERNLLLGGQPADQVERTFHERVEALEEPFEAATREHDKARRRGGAIPGDYGTDQEGSGGDFRSPFRTPAGAG